MSVHAHLKSRIVLLIAEADIVPYAQTTHSTMVADGIDRQLDLY